MENTTKYFISKHMMLEITREENYLHATDMDGREVNIGSLICQYGMDEFWSKCITREEFDAERERLAAARQLSKERRSHEAEIKRQREAEKAARHAEAYARLVESSDGVIESTFENIGIVLAYLNDVNWGGWDLPKMSIGYTCSQYDCDGKTATAMKLDAPIEFGDDDDRQTASMFQFGAPFGHLTKYHRVY